MIKETGIVVSNEHRQAALSKARGVVATPLIIHNGHSIHDDARLDFGDWLDELAVAYGLPVPAKTSDGDVVHYGMDNSGQFTQWVGDADNCAPQDILGT